MAGQSGSSRVLVRTWLYDESALQALHAEGLQRGEAAEPVLQAGEAGEAHGEALQGAQLQQRLGQRVVGVVVLGRQAHLLRSTTACGAQSFHELLIRRI